MADKCSCTFSFGVRVRDLQRRIFVNIDTIRTEQALSVLRGGRCSLELIAQLTVCALQRAHDLEGEGEKLDGASIHVEVLVIRAPIGGGMSVLHALLSDGATTRLRKNDIRARRTITRTTRVPLCPAQLLRQARQGPCLLD